MVVGAQGVCAAMITDAQTMAASSAFSTASFEQNASFLDAWRAALEAADAAAWEPIETAPMDGTEIDLWVVLRHVTNDRYEYVLLPGQRHTDCHYHIGRWLTQQRVTADSTDQCWVEVVNATHWRHRPATPAREAEG